MPLPILRAPEKTPVHTGPALPPLEVSPTRIVVPDVPLPWLEWLEPIPYENNRWKVAARACLHLFVVLLATGIFLESLLRRPPAWLRGRVYAPARPHVEVKRAEFAEPLGRVPSTAEVDHLSTTGEQIEPRGDLIDTDQ